MLYQMIVGAWPLALDPSDAAGCREFTERLSAWQLKAIREEKLETDWTTPNTSYEDTSRRFLFAVMEDQTGFLGEASSFAHRIGPAGAVNGLAQTLLKLTVPGVPDIYQGTEFWDLSLVDPDNRRPVNFSTRMSALQDWLAPPELAATWRDGRVKQAMIARALDLRRRWPSLFARGSYEPLELRGPRADNAIAFLRRDRKAATLVLAPRLPGCLLPDGDSIVIPRHAWSGTVVQLPPATSLRLHDVFRDRWVELEEQAGVEHLIADFPVALFGPD
ncbi:MAG: hypothetical protein JO227_22135 [Acetobacteraceae bacterium]|nr:hypothetical protein [Acetobacteraceae bacterium]